MILQKIKEHLEIQRIKTATSKDIWATYVIQKILKNEKYKGFTMLQKTFTEDYLTRKRKVNHGERAKYYVKILTLLLYQKIYLIESKKKLNAVKEFS